MFSVVLQIVRYQLSASGLKTDEVFFASTRAGQRPRNVANDTVERANAVAIASMVSESTIERIFSRSVSLSSEAIVDFVTQLCRVSEQVCSLATELFQVAVMLW